jgi:pimeloyl-ACP methyl ester carboxylesterase
VQTKRREFIGAEGQKLVGDEAGERHQPTVLLLHGGGQTRHSWGRTQLALAGIGLRVVTLDLRGHGDSEWSRAGDYALEKFAADVAQVIEQLGAGPTVLVGASLGGLASLVVAGEHMVNCLKGVILVDVVHRANPSGVSRIRDFMLQRNDGFSSIEDAAHAVSSYLPHRPATSNFEGLRRNLRQRDGRWYWHWDPAFMVRREDGSHRRFDAERLQRAIRGIEVPTLLLRGELSEIVTEELASEFLRLLPSAKQKVIPDARHMVAGDDNEIFTSAVLEFMDANLFRDRPLARPPASPPVGPLSPRSLP